MWTPRNIQLYQSAANVALLDVNIPECSTVCGGNCCDSAHRNELYNFCNDMSTALLKAAGLCETGKVVNKEVWSKELSELKKAYWKLIICGYVLASHVLGR